MLQIQYQLQPEVVGESTINELVDDALLKLEAPELGIDISQAQVDQELQNLFDYFPNGTPTVGATTTPLVLSTLSEQQLAIITATPTRVPSTPTSTAAATLPATPTLAGPTATVGPTGTPFPTATAVDQAGYEALLADYYDTELSQVGLSEADIREVLYMSLLRNAYLDYLSKDVSHTEEQVWARHILVATEEEAQAVLARLEAGEDFAAVAAEVSLDSSNKDLGGDLGWFPKDLMVEPFANASFDMRIGETSDPVESEFGFHIIQVLGHEQRPLTQSAYDARVQQAYDAIVQTLRDKYTWEINDSWKGIVPDKPSIPALQ
jgi:parvulin-like peptidyl-prolyl isomerase